MPAERDRYISRCVEGTRQSKPEQINVWMGDFTAPNILLLTGGPRVVSAVCNSELDGFKANEVVQLNLCCFQRLSIAHTTLSPEDTFIETKVFSK